MEKRKLPVTDLNLGFNDAENYKKPEHKELFNKIFIDNSFLKKIALNSTYFVLGEKGTGKTAYAVHFVNNEHNNNIGILNYIRETDYQKFITLKKDKHLELSDFTSIWKVIIYLLIAEKIKQTETHDSLFSSKKFASLQKAIDEYYAAAFSPEILQALNFVEKSKVAAEIIAKHAKLTGEKIKENSFTHSKFQTNLFYIQKHFEDALSSIKVSKGYTLFIDGIDIRPRNIDFEEYLDCIKGLSNAVWSVNNDFFANLNIGFNLRAVILLRPDIYAYLGLQNQNNKLRDNGVLLNWITTFNTYENSPLFELADKLLDAQQPFHNKLGECWEYYFPYKIQNSRTGKITDSSFVSFLRFSYYKPRDFVSMLSILKEIFISKNRSKLEVFKKSDFDSDEFRTQFSEYLLSEIKDQILFFNSEEEYQILIDFFQHIKGKVDFTYEEYEKFYINYIAYLTNSNTKIPNFLNSVEKFIQFLYSNNIIAYIEFSKKEAYMRWCFRERNYSNISPKVQLNARYTIHYGLHKALNLGQKIVTSRHRTSKRK
jgi:hypothetical protein